MAEIRVGEIWLISIAGQTRKVQVVGKSGAPGWWKCIDLETGVEFNALERWFVKPVAG